MQTLLFEAGTQEVNPKSPGGWVSGSGKTPKETSEATAASCLLVTTDTRLQKGLDAPTGDKPVWPWGQVAGFVLGMAGQMGTGLFLAGRSALWVPSMEHRHTCFCLKSGGPGTPQHHVLIHCAPLVTETEMASAPTTSHRKGPGLYGSAQDGNGRGQGAGLSLHAQLELTGELFPVAMSPVCSAHHHHCKG